MYVVLNVKFSAYSLVGQTQFILAKKPLFNPIWIILRDAPKSEMSDLWTIIFLNNYYFIVDYNGDMLC